MIQFENDNVRATYEKVGGYLREVFGEMAHARDEDPAWLIIEGSAAVNVAVHPWGDNDTIVRAWSWVVTGAEVTPELTRYLLDENFKMRFGAFSMDPAGDICFEYAIVGSTCDKEELKAAVLAVAFTADNEDDAITSRFGGQRACDR
jgi:hypothetical protein